MGMLAFVVTLSWKLMLREYAGVGWCEVGMRLRCDVGMEVDARSEKKSLTPRKAAGNTKKT